VLVTVPETPGHSSSRAPGVVFLTRKNSGVLGESWGYQKPRSDSRGGVQITPVNSMLPKLGWHGGFWNPPEVSSGMEQEGTRRDDDKQASAGPSQQVPWFHRGGCKVEDPQDDGEHRAGFQRSLQLSLV
jgi:hypothetical protein